MTIREFKQQKQREETGSSSSMLDSLPRAGESRPPFFGRGMLHGRLPTLRPAAARAL